jgi:class 3 adenylate cyclase
MKLLQGSQSKSGMQGRLILWLLLAYALMLTGQALFSAFAPREQERESRRFYLQHAQRLAQPLLREGRGREAVNYLTEAVSTGMIDYFRWEAAGKSPLSRGSEPPVRPVISEGQGQAEGWLWGKVDVNDGTLWVASDLSWKAHLLTALKMESGRLAADVVFLVVACLSVLLYAQSQRAARPMEPLGRKAPASGRNQPTAPSIQGPVPLPEEIQGACGRTALANYSELAASCKREDFFAALDSFFTACGATIGRYHGKVHAVQGHEILYYLPGADGKRQARLALALARDLESLAEKHGFRLATGLAHGLLHGGHVFSTFTLLGSPIEETSELLTLSNGPGKNVIWVTDAFAALCGPAAKFRSVPVEGRLPSRQTLFKQNDVESALELARHGDTSELAFHRGDAALLYVLQSLAGYPAWERENYMKVLGELGRFPCLGVGEAVVEAYRRLLQQAVDARDSYRLASVLSLAPHLLERRKIDANLEKLFFSAITVKDRRVRANAVALFTAFFPERPIPELRSLVQDEDNRVSANALVKAALERFDDKVIARIDQRVRGGSVAHVASALFALGEIAAYYRKHDPLFLGTKTSFLRIFLEVPVWVQHPNPMIRRQALHAAHKLQDEELDAKLRLVFEETQEEELTELFASIYGWRKKLDKAA